MKEFYCKKMQISMLLKFTEPNRSAGLNFMNFDSLRKIAMLKIYYWDLWICFEYSAQCAIACEKARPRTTDTQWIWADLGRFGRQNMLQLYLKIWEWELIFGCAVKAISSPGVRSPWYCTYVYYVMRGFQEMFECWVGDECFADVWRNAM